MFRTFAAAACLAITSLPASAVVLDFEGTTTGANRQLGIATAGSFGPSLIDYAGYRWVGMFVARPLISVNRPQQIVGFENDPEDGPIPLTSPVDTGFHRSFVSGDTVAFTQAFSGASSLFASILALPGQQNFNFLSTYMTSAYRGDINVTVTGLRGTDIIYSRDFVVGNSAPSLIDLNFLNISEIQFRTSGGSFLYPNGTTIGSFVNPSNAFSAPVLAFDDMNIAPVPEPTTIAMMLAGLGVLGFVARRSRRAV
jgi:hypothetical protein